MHGVFGITPNKTSAKDVDELIEFVANNDATFYRSHWGSARSFNELPPISREDFKSAPLSQRRYKEGKALVKIVRDERGSFLSEWSAEDIQKEPYGEPSKRPMVYLSNSHESLEKGAWCHLNGMAALVGEKEPEVAMSEAEQYEIDSLITDQSNLAKLRPYLERRDTELLSISIIGASFDAPALITYSKLAEKVRLVLSLPEVGAFALSSPETYPRFDVLPGCIVEHADAILVTKLARLVTPVIRYRFESARAAKFNV